MEEKRVNKELFERIKIIEKDKSVLENKLDYVKLKLSKKVLERAELDRKVECEKSRVHNEKQRRYLSSKNKNMELLEKDKEISELNKILFGMSDEMN